MITTIDLHFQGLEANIAAFLLDTPDGWALVETGPHSTLPKLLEGLAAAGVGAQDIRHVFLSHIHLDHAGAAWWFAQKGAQIYVHPAGAAHLASPERLMESARRIYLDKMDELWGEMHPIEQARITLAEDGVPYPGGLIAWHTPGHAVHHIAWQWGDSLFTGDVAGVSINGGLIIPPCPPPDIHLDDWLASTKKIRTLSPKTLYLTHFGAVSYSEKHFDELDARLKKWINWILPYYESGQSVQDVTPAFQAMVRQEMLEFGLPEAAIQQYEAANPSWMSVAGLLRYWKKHNP